MNAKTPKRLNHHTANFVAGLGTLSLSSGIFLMPQIDTDAKGDIVPLLLTAVFCFSGWKVSDFLIESIKDKEFSKKREAFVVWCLPVIYILVFAVISNLLFVSHQYSDNALASSQISFEEPTTKIDITFSSQAAQGLTQEEMNEVFLQNYEAYSLERLKHHIEQAKKSGLVTISPNQINTVSSYVEIGEKKLAVVRMTSPSDASVFVLGLINDEIKRVGCMHELQDNISITYGKCGNKIKEIFNLP